jgi:hypothetical protein
MRGTVVPSLILGLAGCLHIGDAREMNLPVETNRQHLHGVRGKAFRVDLASRRFELLTETLVDPQTDEGRSRHMVQWAEDAGFIKVVKQNGFMGVAGSVLVHVRDLDEENALAASQGKPFVVMDVIIPSSGEKAPDVGLDQRSVVGVFTPDPDSERQWGGTIHLNGQDVPMRLRGPRARVAVRTPVEAAEFAVGFWETQIAGGYVGNQFVASQLDLFPLVDPRTVDDPSLPRVLVIGDSISMNYHDAAKAALEGVANYYRIEGNGGPTTRGVVATELWLGDFREKGLHWDVIQFNFGLHDLRQSYDPQADAFGDHQVGVDDYKANLERIIGMLRETGATLIWCTTTPVPQSSTARWPDPVGFAGRRKDEDLVYNAAAMEVIRQHPDILVTDLNTFIRQSPAFEEWLKQSDVHFWSGDEAQRAVGAYVAEQVKRALMLRTMK